MLKDFNCVCPVCIACGYTDLRRGIDGLADIVRTQFQMDPFQTALFLFCGRRRDRIKALYWESDGFLLLEESFAELTPEQRYTKRLEQEKPVLDALLEWANETISKAAPKSAFGKALHYLLEQWPYLVRYLEDGRLKLSNNHSERNIKPFVMGRKNWLFANTPAGAQSSAVIYSLIETAKENKLDPYRYLLWILRSAPILSQANQSRAESLLPAKAPQECLVPQS